MLTASWKVGELRCESNSEYAACVLSTYVLATVETPESTACKGGRLSGRGSVLQHGHME